MFGREFWLRAHGASTHLPIVLFAISVLFDFTAVLWRDESAARGLRFAGFVSAAIGLLGTFGAIASGLIISRGQTLGTGALLRHHQFVWPAFAIALVFVGWRVLTRNRSSQRSFSIYLAGMFVASSLTIGAAYWGGELAFTGGAATPPDPVLVARGHHLFLLNCAHCHADDATGDEGPDLHGLRKSDERLALLIQNGVKGEMPRFDKKLTSDDVQALIAFLRSLHG
ncbi:MAG: cytochrome c [Verrucomicrobia bacterium]|nr:cytochrome c [Verrucomicrobiota bacterium]